MIRVGLGVTMGTMNQSQEAASSGIGGWFDGVTYMAGLSGGSWGTGTFMANGGQLPTALVTNVSAGGRSFGKLKLMIQSSSGIWSRI